MVFVYVYVCVGLCGFCDIHSPDFVILRLHRSIWLYDMDIYVCSFFCWLSLLCCKTLNPFAWHYANTWTKSSKYTAIRSFAYNIVLPLRKFELYSFVVKHDMTVEHTHLNSSCLWIKTHVLNMVTFNVFCPAKSYNSSTQVHVFIHIFFYA